MSVTRLGVVGAGTMGAGIAQLGCLAGWETLLHDPDPAALATGADRLEAALAKGAGRGRWSASEAASAAARLVKCTALAELAPCELVVEAAPEELGLKRELFARLEELCARDAVLATNTSSLPVSAIAAELERPERACGMHFFNPPALMKLVEVVAGERTAEATLATAEDAARAMGREPVRAADAPGFIVNRCNRPYTLEALRILGEGVAPHDAIDRAMRGAGYRMGPFELMDLIGIDVNLEVARSFHRQRPIARWEPHPIQAELVAAGRLGRKAGRGFYEYRAGERIEPERGVPLTQREEREVTERIVACLVNEAAWAVDEGVAAGDDVDTAMRLGLNHPRGPFEWLAELGAERVLDVLGTLAERTGERERYRPAESLAGAIGSSGG